MTLSLALIALLDFPKYKVIRLRPEHLEVVGNGIGVRVDVVGHTLAHHLHHTVSSCNCNPKFVMEVILDLNCVHGELDGPLFML